MSAQPKQYGWFSPTAQLRSDIIVTYDTLDKGPVMVSSITKSPTDSGTTWKDIICVGEVTNFIASKKNNILETSYKRY